MNYDNHNWKLLEKTLKENPNSIPLLNRVQLINDAFELAENGLVSYDIPFELAQYISNEKHYLPWASLLNSLDFLRGILRNTHLNGDYDVSSVDTQAIFCNL